jgi:hypothetical protein
MLAEGEAEADSDMEGEAIALDDVAAEGAVDAPGSAVAPPPHAASVRGKLMAAARVATLAKREVVNIRCSS